MNLQTIRDNQAMDEKQNFGKKPLRPSINKTMDLAKTYFKNNGNKNMNKNNKHEQNNSDAEKEIEVNIETPSNEQNSSEANTFSETEVADMLAKIEQLAKERDEAKEIMLRNAAELENFRRRTMKEKEDLVLYANERLLEKFIEILDTLDTAVDTGKQSNDYNAVLQGLILIRDKTLKLFEEAGTKQIDTPVGKEFNVDEMDAILAMPSEEIPDGHVVQVVSTGYTYHDKVLKHAKVITSAGPAPKG